MPSKKKKYNARFPPARIKKIMQTDEEVGKVAAAVPVIISRALELFVEQLLRKSVEITISRNAKTLSPAHLKQCILAENRFDFLKDLVLSIPDVQGDGEECVSVPSTPVTGGQPPVFRSHSVSDATTSGRRPTTTGRPRGRPRKNHTVPQPVCNTKSASDDEESDAEDSDEDDDDEEDATDAEPQPKVARSSTNGVAAVNPTTSFQFNAAQPNFYQEINNSVPFQINIPPNNGAVNDKGKTNDDEDYDT